MKKTTFYATAMAVMLSAGLFSIVACQKEEETNKKEILPTKTITLNDITRMQLAQQLALSMAAHPNSYAELNYAISVVRNYGLDEFVTFYDILSTDNSVFLLPNTPLNNLRTALQESQIIEYCGLTENNHYANLQLYWPNHDNWDNTTQPIVVFVPVDESATNLTGFRVQGNDVYAVNLNTRILDQDSITPYIVINENEFNYTDYPDFKNGVFSTAFLTWIRSLLSFGDEPYVNEIRQGGDTIVKASFYKFHSSGEQYDDWISGGSEFCLTLARVNLDGSLDTMRCIIPMTRKEIKNNATIRIDEIVHHNWKPECGPVHYYFCEHDGWGSMDTIHVNLSYEGSSVSTAIKINNADDFIASDNMTWADYINRCQVGPNIYQFGQEQFYCKAKVFSTPSL